MPSQTDNRSAIVRLLRHHDISGDAFEAVMFHFDQSIASARLDGRDEAFREAIDKLQKEMLAGDCEETLA